MNKTLLCVLAILLVIALMGCESIEYYETNQFDLLIFNGNISIVGYKDGYYSEDLVIDEIVTYYNVRVLNGIDSAININERRIAFRIGNYETEVWNDFHFMLQLSNGGWALKL